jgi:hypothetical protein
MSDDTPGFGDEPRQVTIHAAGAKATVTVDGKDLSRSLAGYQVEHRAGRPPFVILFAKESSVVDFEGMAQVAVATETPPGEAIAAFLRGIDPAALSAAALERDDLDGSRHELTTAMLAQLADWALGRI